MLLVLCVSGGVGGSQVNWSAFWERSDGGNRAYLNQADGGVVQQVLEGLGEGLAVAADDQVCFVAGRPEGDEEGERNQDGEWQNPAD